MAKSRIAQRSPRPFSIGVPVERDACARRDLAQLLRRVVRRVLDRLRFVEDDARPLHLGDRVDVADRGAVGREHDVGVGELRRDLVGPGAARAVVHDNAELGGEAFGFGRPVADDRGRRDHERRPVGHAGEEVREHRRRLAEAHVEREASAETARIEEAEPRERLGLVAAELADESGRRARGLGLDLLGRGEQVGRPSPTDEVDPARERRLLEAEREAQHLGARELLGLGPFGERLGRGLEVGLLDRDPATAGTDQRARFLREPGDLRGRELDVVEDGRPRDVRELVRTRRRIGRRVDVHAQRRHARALGELGDAHVEARLHEARPRRRHHVPCFLGTEHDLAAARAARPQQRGHHALETRHLVFEVAAVGARHHDRLLDREGPAARVGGEHLEAPRVAAVGCVEPDDQPLVRFDDGARPTFDARHDLTADRLRRIERAAVEAGEERFGDVVRSAHLGRRRGNLEAAGAVAADRVDHAGERRSGERAGVDLAVEREHASRRVLGHAFEPGGIDERRRPAHGVGTARAARARAAARAAPELRHDRAARGELDRPDRDASEPAHARTDAFPADLTGARRAQPAQHLTDGNRERIRVPAAGQRHGRVLGPARLGRARRDHERDDLVGERDRCAPARGPRHDAPGLPRQLQLHLARVARPWCAAGRRALALRFGLVVCDLVVRFVVLLGLRSEAVRRGHEPPQLAFEIGDDLGALLTRQRASARQVVLGLVAQLLQRDAPPERVGFEHRELFGRGVAVGFGGDVRVELPRRESAGGAGRCHFGHASPSGIHGGHAGVPSKKHGLAARESGHHPRPDLGSFARRRNDLADSVPARRDS